VLVETDPEGRVAEEREDNNRTASHTLVVDCPPPPQPDLVVESLCRAERLCAGATTFVCARVRNAGLASAASSRAKLRFYQGGECQVDHVALLPEEGQDLTCSLATPAAGTGFVEASVDVSSQVAESDESNNIISELLSVESCTPPLAADLIVASVQFSPSSVEPGRPVSVLAQVSNQGTKTAPGPTHVVFDEVDARGVRVRGLCEFFVPGDVPPGTGPLVNCPVAAFTAGAHYVQVRVNVDGFVEESILCNNATTAKLTAAAPEDHDARESAVAARGPGLATGRCNRGRTQIASRRTPASATMQGPLPNSMDHISMSI
jgi:subtilase family serine protease